jgi:cytochrome c-type biogenesis protein CcmH
MSRLAVLLWALLLPFAAHAVTEPTMLDPVEQRRLVDLSAQLRCLVCQNQSIAESNAELAVDLRNQINEQIKAGKSDREIVDFMVTRYGDFVLYRPPFKMSTLVLWVGPLALLLIAVFVFWRTLKARRAAMAQEARPLTDAERAEAQRLLGLQNQKKPS